MGAQSTYIYSKNRAVFGVFRTIDTHPLSTQRVFPPPAPKAVRGWGPIIRKTPDIGLASYIIIPLRMGVRKVAEFSNRSLTVTIQVYLKLELAV
jgi:hypothetical protein